jgi:protein gp37
MLTKRPEAAREFFKTRTVPDCVWFGVTVGVRSSRWRLDVLREIDARVRFVSAEPLLEDLTPGLDLSGIHWLIGGGESGSHLSAPKVLAKRGMVRRGDRKIGEQLWVPREDRMAWARNLRDACKESGVAFWWKQWGGPQPKSGGRELDSETWDELPEHIGAMPVAYDGKVGNRRLPLA